MATYLLSAICLSLLLSAAIGQRSPQLREARQCRLQRLTAGQPSQRIESEGGFIELWDENQDQFQCVGVAALRATLRPNSLHLPSFQPSPRLVYIERGEGLLGITFPGCAETYHSQQSERTREEGQEEERQREGRRGRDQHQKVHRIRRGDILAIPAGAVHWCFNDGKEELIAIVFNDVNNQANQLDQRNRAFYLAGGLQRKEQHGEQARQSFQNVFRGFDAELLAEALYVPSDIVRKMQQEDDRGLIVNVREGLRVIRPDEQGEGERGRGPGEFANGFEETFCTMKVRTNIENRREADIYSRQAGRLNIANEHKLPILRSLDISAERGNLFPNALFTPHWNINAHTVIYVIRGDAQVQVVGANGQTVLNNRVNEGELFVIPQYFASTIEAGKNGFEWVSIKTTSSPMKSPLAGYTSVFRAMPLDVITNSYQVSPSEAQNLKLNRGGQTYLLSPGRRSQ
ncbi:unnamed protein product [Ilex paraguariensis]|uniref:Cupin type-1 domain-containing protein n=1 Tax=Ilex paraguariensis TaxID=185542 RepID=A0ABC8TKN5_9AQUA